MRNWPVVTSNATSITANGTMKSIREQTSDAVVYFGAFPNGQSRTSDAKPSLARPANGDRYGNRVLLHVDHVRHLAARRRARLVQARPGHSRTRSAAHAGSRPAHDRGRFDVGPRATAAGGTDHHRPLRDPEVDASRGQLPVQS